MHTKGPWKAVRDCQNFDETFDISFLDKEDMDEYMSRPYTKIITSENKSIVTNHDMFAFKNPADAHLIAAAPDLLEAVEEILKGMKKDLDSDDEDIKKLSKLILKARGEL